MGLIEKETFVCFDCETTGLDTQIDQIIEIAIVKFTFQGWVEDKQNLIDPGIPIPKETIEIHHITDEMVKGKPKIREVLSRYLEIIGDHIVIGHAISFDIAFLSNAAKKYGIPTSIEKQRYIDTVRLARLYGQSPNNSLETLRLHFNIDGEGAHRAMNDVKTNIEVFRLLTKQFKTTEDIFKRLQKPILLSTMPLGKHKGRPFRELSTEYLTWAARQKFDKDLLFSLRSELKKRKQGGLFHQMSNPFSGL